MSIVIEDGVAATRSGKMVVFHRPEDTADLGRVVVVSFNVRLIPGVEEELKTFLLDHTNKQIQALLNLPPRTLAEMRRFLGIPQGEGVGGARPGTGKKLHYQWVKLDMPVAQVAPGSTSPGGVLGLVPMQHKWVNRDKRFYLCGARPYLLLVILRHGIEFSRLMPGVFMRCVVGWHDGEYGFVPEEQKPYRHSKLSVDMVVAVPEGAAGDADFILMSEFLAGVPILGGENELL